MRSDVDTTAALARLQQLGVPIAQLLVELVARLERQGDEPGRVSVHLDSPPRKGRPTQATIAGEGEPERFPCGGGR